MSLAPKAFSVPADLGHSALVRDAVRQFFAAAGFDSIWVGRLVLVADELFMNAVKYGSEAGDSIKVELSQAEDGEIHCAITDNGASGITPSELQKKIESHGDTHTPRKTSGRGLAIITRNWTDRYEVKAGPDHRITVAFTKKIERAEKPSKTAAQPNVNPGGTVIKLAGEIDESSLQAKTAVIERFLEIEKNKDLVLDLGEVIFINSAFIGRLASWHTLLEQRCGKLLLLKVQPQVQEILTLVGINQIIEVK